MPVIPSRSDILEGSQFGSGSYIAPSFLDVTPRQCESERERIILRIETLERQINDLGSEQKKWAALKADIERFRVENAGELPDEIYRKHKLTLDKPIVVTL